MTYNATAQVDDSTYVSVDIRPAFTPDGDGINDTFNLKNYNLKYDSITSVGFKLMIFDRWGDIIFTTNDRKKGWDGTRNNGKEIMKEDVYIWKVEYFEKEDGKKISFNGHITLIR